MDGHALGIFLVDALIGTLEDLADHEIKDPVILLDELQKQESTVHELMLKSALPVSSIFSPGNGASPDPTLDLELLWKGPSLCRTGRLPSQSRYLGYTTNTNKVGNIALLGSEEYDTGISILHASIADVAKNGSMVLAYQPGGIDRTPCNVLLKPDYKDFFYANQIHGMVSLSVPNEKERHAYGYDSSKYKGLILLVFYDCEWGKCAKGELRPEDYSSGKFNVLVNGKNVKELTFAGFEAWILKGDDGFYWEANSNGVFEVGFSVEEEHGFIKLSSIMLY